MGEDDDTTVTGYNPFEKSDREEKVDEEFEDSDESGPLGSAPNGEPMDIDATARSVGLRTDDENGPRELDDAGDLNKDETDQWKN